ncbi:chorion transcription factor Cf2 isoform X1 [Bactrocera tryoni]|uniref:chorion transcription factor Cf2 isoform X1 n=2 Tax=Bactrocera tryoni TaxID=59916 RepID=UPI001A97460F|nr:chorion transcription factor Cf2 isoform X1 [Bactrocera tryoni]
MLKSSSNAQELRLSRPESTVPQSTITSAAGTMDTLKTSFLPNLAMDGGVITSASFCPMCGQQFERPQHAQEHMQLCHGISAGMIGGGGVIGGGGASVGVGGLLLSGVPQPNAPVTDPMKIEYPCMSCEEKFGSAQELDEHHRIIHQSTAFLARCMACGIYGISSVTLHEGDEFKCMHCGSVSTASNMTAPQQPPYMDQPEPPQTPEEMPSIPPEEMNTIPPDELNSRQNQQQQQRQQQVQQQQQHQQQVQQHQQQQQQHQQRQQQPDLLEGQRQPQPDLLDQQQQQVQQQQQQQQQPTPPQANQQQQQATQLKVPPLTVKLNKNSNGNTEGHPHVIIKEEPLGISDGNGDIEQASVPVYTIQQPAGATSVVVSTATATGAANATGTTSAAGSTTAATPAAGNKVRHKCPECPKTFKTPGTLAMHRKIHTGEADVTPKERPYTCSYCGKSFTQSNTLKQHTRIHTGEKPFRCGYCGRQFTVKDYLNKHLTTHTGEKPFNCIYCEKRFSVKDYLTKHIRTHTGEKPYTCPYCDKRFTQRSALTVHTTKLHPL